MMTKYDLTIIGAGSGGLTAARLAAALGAHVLLVDKERLGGDCLYYGCVPSKSLIYVAHVVQQAKKAEKMDLVSATPSVNMAKVGEYIQGVIARVAEGETIYSEGVTAKFGKIAFQSSTDLVLNGETFTSRNTLVATGSRPAVPDVEGLQETGYMTNEDAFDLVALPPSLVIVGAGPVGVELGQAFERLGSKVTIVQGPDRLLPKEDPDVSTAVARVLESEGIDIVTGARFVRASRSGDKKAVTATQGDKLLHFEADEILLALGRKANIEGLNLEAAGVKYNNQGIQVDEYLRTTASNILAIGDVIGGYRFTHVAAYQSGVAVRNALVPFAKKRVDYRVVPWCTFTDPEVAHVGLTPDEAGRRHKQVRSVKLPWADIDRAQTESTTVGFLKLVLVGKKDELVGAHMVGARAGELLGELSLAMQHNLTLNDILNTIHAYPTMNSGIQQAVFEAYLEGAATAHNRNIVRAVLHLRS
jgi:pyruvate/2-oxoglutarate dehydrogenase complex dihydrolipoamide dehydrogenase (E3) component